MMLVMFSACSIAFTSWRTDCFKVASKLLNGSSIKMILGLGAKDLAKATRCC